MIRIGVFGGHEGLQAGVCILAFCGKGAVRIHVKDEVLEYIYKGMESAKHKCRVCSIDWGSN